MADNKKIESDIKEKLVAINRITKVVKGGRRFGFAALVVVGNQKGSVGIGQGKSKQVPDAIKKATEVAKRSLIKIPLKDGRTLHHDVNGKNGSHNTARAEAICKATNITVLVRSSSVLIVFQGSSSARYLLPKRAIFNRSLLPSRKRNLSTAVAILAGKVCNSANVSLSTCVFVFGTGTEPL